MTKRLSELIVDFGWSLWSELGVPGVIRHHRHVAIDPEPLIVASPWLFRDDARLQAEVARWCVAHADRISVSRLNGLLKSATPDLSAAFHDLAKTLRGHGVLWTTDRAATSKTPASRTSTPKPLALPTTRPALIRLRVRALVGVGARADILAELLGHPKEWLIASDLQHLGYSKRNVARVLGELADATVVTSRADKNAVAFQLTTPLLSQMLAGQRLAWPPWAAVFSFIEDLQRLRADQDKSEVVRKVAAAKAAGRFDVASVNLGLERLLRVSEVSWSSLVDWAEEQMAAFVDGTAAPFQAARTQTQARAG
jgi:hypothetical protein